MGASLDEYSYNYSIDAPYGASTNFYILVGDNAYGYSYSSTDYDCYAIHLNYGQNYTIASIDGMTPTNNYSGTSTIFFARQKWKYNKWIAIN